MSGRNADELFFVRRPTIYHVIELCANGILIVDAGQILKSTYYPHICVTLHTNRPREIENIKKIVHVCLKE